jgi:hypothetical protein
LHLLHLIHSQSSRLHIIQLYRYSTHFAVHRYTRTRVLFTSRILATDLSQSHCHFKTYMSFSLHHLLISCHYSATANSEHPTQFNSSAPKLIFRQAGVSKLDSSLESITMLSHQVQVQVILRLTVSQSVCLGVKPRLGAMDRFLYLFFFLYEIFCPVQLGRPL